jgi:hypothetical protein
VAYHEQPPIELEFYPDARRAAWAMAHGHGQKKMTYREAQEFFNSQVSQIAAGPARLSCDCCCDRHKSIPEPYTPPGQIANFCGQCGQDFLSETGFDEHRIGPFEPYERRCLTQAELEEAGWSRDRHGRWRRPVGEQIVARVSL